MFAWTEKRVLRQIPVTAWETQRWDKEWINYLNLHGTAGYLLDHSQRQPAAAAVACLAALTDEEMLEAHLFDDLQPLRVWVPGAELVGKAVLEVGCGPGYLGKQLGGVASEYLGLDYSQLALSIARLLSPPGCTYLHLSQADALRKQRGRFDALVGRYFFIHQNFDNATWLLHLARLLLRPGGRVHADFYRRAPAVPQGVIFPAKSPLSPVHASCAFEYTEDDAQELARLTGFKVIKVQRHPAMQRLFVRFERT